MNLTPPIRCAWVSGWAIAIVAAAAFSAVTIHAAEPSAEIVISEATSTQARLAAYRWKFLNAEAANGQAQPELRALADSWPGSMQIWFSEEGSGGIRACNSIGWRYTVVGDKGIRFEQFFSTTMACAYSDGHAPVGTQDVMAMESRMGPQLSKAQSFSLSLATGSTPPLLTLRFADGSRWNFSGEPTLTTKYGDDKQTLLLEVDAEQQACGEEGPSSKQQCMRVREVRWERPNSSDYIHNARMKQLSLNLREMNAGKFDWSAMDKFDFVGPWQLMPLDKIDGFKHKPGVRTIEYVDKYRLRNQPSGAPEVAYVYGSRMVPYYLP